MRRLLVVALVLSAAALAQQPPVRVRLLSLYHLKQLTVVPEGASALRWDAEREELHGPVAVARDGELVRVGGHAARTVKIEGRVRLEVENARPVRISAPLEVTVRNGELRVIAAFPMEDYVAAVLQGETAGDMPPEALKAMAVAVRSYATKFRERHGDEGFDFCDSTHCQYLRTEVGAKVTMAVQETRDELLWDRGSPLAAYYHKDCGGRTEDAAAVWPDQRSAALVAHDDPYCVRLAKPWRSEVSREDVQRALDSAGLRVPARWDRIEIVERTASGRARALRFTVGNSQQAMTVAGSSFRFAMGQTLGWNTLKSDWYEVSGSGDHFVFSGRGTGHGVGLCQTGAAEMAREGKTYREILAFYYPGAEMGKSAKAIPWIEMHESEFDLRMVNREDELVIKAADEAWAWAKEQTGLKVKARPVVDVYPTVAMFRNATGEPGWVAGSTRENHIRLEPPAVLKEQLGPLLRHEFLHLLIEGNAKPGTPLWFREGLVLFLSGDFGKPNNAMTNEEIDAAIAARGSEAEVKRAYAAAAARVAQLDDKQGRQKLLAWLRDGLPADAGVIHSDEITK